MVVKLEVIEDITYTSGDSFIVGPKTTKHTINNAKKDNKIVCFAAKYLKDFPIPA